MPKLILRCNYLKNSPPAHLANYINYIGTREGVEKVGSTTSSLPATDRQKSLIEDILAKIPEKEKLYGLSGKQTGSRNHRYSRSVFK